MFETKVNIFFKNTTFAISIREKSTRTNVVFDDESKNYQNQV